MAVLEYNVQLKINRLFQDTKLEWDYEKAWYEGSFVEMRAVWILQGVEVPER